MRNSLVLLAALTLVGGAGAQISPGNLVLVKGGAFRNTKSHYYGKTLTNSYVGRLVTVTRFYIGKYEVTQKEWITVMGDNPSRNKGDNLPVEMVSWYDCVEYCNKRSVAEGLTPYYTIAKDKPDPNNRNEIDNIKWLVSRNAGAKGYRLPTEIEWEYAAGGGQLSRSYTYSGSNDVDQVAWYFKNSGDKELNGIWNWHMIEQNHNRTQPVGSKAPNELGLYDMSGNVREWCWNWYGETVSVGSEPAGSSEGRVWKGGGWLGGDFCCASSWRASYEASGRGPDQGLRLCRDE